MPTEKEIETIAACACCGDDNLTGGCPCEPPKEVGGIEPPHDYYEEEDNHE